MQQNFEIKQAWEVAGNIGGLLRLVEKYLTINNQETMFESLRSGNLNDRERGLWHTLNLHFNDHGSVLDFYTHLNEDAAKFLAYVKDYDQNQHELMRLADWLNSHKMHAEVIKETDESNKTVNMFTRHSGCEKHILIWFDGVTSQETTKFLKDAEKAIKYFADLFEKLDYGFYFDDVGADDLIFDLKKSDIDTNKVLVIDNQDEEHIEPVLQYVAQALGDANE